MSHLNKFDKEIHLKYLSLVEQSRDYFSYGGIIREHLGLPGAYWSITSCYIIKKTLNKELIENLWQWILQCQNEDGGFGGNQKHDSNITCTLYALIISMLFEKFEDLNHEKIYDFLIQLYDEKEGSFRGDKYGETDGRFCYSAIYCLKLLNKEIPQNCIDYYKQTYNYDGGFGGTPQAESHAAYVFCAVGALQIMQKIEEFDKEQILKFLSLRQTSQGGFNGRPEKLPDVCYSWWVLSSIYALTDKKIINEDQLVQFICECQDMENGGFGDRPGNGTDVFHTFFALSALSLINNKKYDLVQIHPVYAIPNYLVEKYIDKNNQQKNQKNLFRLNCQYQLIKI